MHNPSPENYTLGGGRLLFNKTGSDGNKVGLRDLGNCPAFTVSVEVEKLDHYSSASGTKKKDKSIVRQLTPKATITLDEINAENIALTFMAGMEKVVQVAASDKTKTVTVKQGFLYELDEVFVDDTPANFTVTSDSAATTHVYGDDYLIEGKSGKIKIVPGGDIADDTEIVVTFNVLAQTFTKLNAFTEKTVEGEIQFISDVASGNDQQLKIWKVSVTPSGEMGFISEDWNSLEFEVEILDDSANHPLYPFMEGIIESE